jgi:hypothetical protein
MFPARAAGVCFPPPSLAGNYLATYIKQALPVAMSTHQNPSQGEIITQDPP